jgi:hypothetical protein
MSPAGYWRLGEASGTAADNAEGTAARDGTYVGTPTLGATGALHADADKAVTLNGTSQMITVADAAIWDCFEGTNPWTVAMWVNCTTPSDPSYLFYKRSSDWASAIQLKSFTTGLEFVRLTAAHTDDLTVAALGAGWHFVVFTYSGTTIRMYVDGALAATTQGSTAATQSMPALSGTLQVGGVEWSANGIPGQVDEIAVWNRAITAAEVSSLMDAGTV